MSRFLILHIRAGTARQKIDDSDFLQKKKAKVGLYIEKRRFTLFLCFQITLQFH